MVRSSSQQSNQSTSTLASTSAGSLEGQAQAKGGAVQRQVSFAGPNIFAYAFSACGPSVELSADGKTATLQAEMTGVALVGRSVCDGNRLHMFTVVIENSRLNFGGALTIGVTDATGSGWSCGFNPYCGGLLVSESSSEVDYNQEPCQMLMQGTLQGRSNGTSVTVAVDMSRGQLAFSVGLPGAAPQPLVLASKVSLPRDVRPWVHMYKRGDCVRIERPRLQGRARSLEPGQGAAAEGDQPLGVPSPDPGGGGGGGGGAGPVARILTAPVQVPRPTSECGTSRHTEGTEQTDGASPGYGFETLQVVEYTGEYV